MGIKSVLFQNFYMDSNEVIEAGERIRSVMATVDGCMEEADSLFCRYLLWQKAFRLKQGVEH